MNTKSIGIVAAVVIICCGASFYAGMQYQQSHGRTTTQNTFAAGNRTGRFGQGQSGTNSSSRTAPTIGSVLSKDATSITVKLANGGSQIAFYTASTSVMKTSQSSVGDLNVGDQVMVNGTANPDGSMNAQSIQSGFESNRFRGAVGAGSPSTASN